MPELFVFAGAPDFLTMFISLYGCDLKAMIVWQPPASTARLTRGRKRFTLTKAGDLARGSWISYQSDNVVFDTRRTVSWLLYAAETHQIHLPDTHICLKS
jgi:hypothetical protein